MEPTPAPASPEPASPAAAPPAQPPAAPDGPKPSPRPARPILLGVLGGCTATALLLALWSQQRLGQVEKALVKRQEASQRDATEARLLAKEAQDAARESIARATLLEARVGEVAVQRGQLDELMQTLLRSRDDHLIAEADSSLRAALQLAAISGSAEPIVAALTQARGRLSAADSVRLAPILRAIDRDLEAYRSTPLPDLASLARRLDQALRWADELTLLQDPARGGPTLPPTTPAASNAAPGGLPLPAWLGEGLDSLAEALRGLLRVRRVDTPDAMLLAPDQAVLLRENLKLRLLNARLALLSRQFDTAQGDLQAASDAVLRHFDPEQRRHAPLLELLRGVARQAQGSSLPRPDESIAALAAAQAAR